MTTTWDDVERARQGVEAARDKLRVVELQFVRETHGVYLGAIVHDNRRQGRVTDIVLWDKRNKPWVSARQIKKDGTEGFSTLNFYSTWRLGDRIVTTEANDPNA